MAYPGLSLEQAPPISGPFRFFLTAPLLGIAAALLLPWLGDGALVSRWSPGILAVVHLLTLGLLAMVMFGAMLQMLPVVAGSPVSHPLGVATLLHLLLTAGTLALALGLARGTPWLLQGAALLLAGAVVLFASVAGLSLWRTPRAHAAVRGMALAVAALVLASGLGLYLLAGHGWATVPLARGVITDLHAGWGLLGWVGLLVIGVAFQVVPMFQMTPAYPAWMQRWLPPLVVAALAAWSLFALGAWAGRLAAEFALAALLALFAVATLQLQRRRKRPVVDATLNFWRLGMALLLLTVVLWLAGQLWPAWGDDPRYPLLLGGVMLLGFATSVMVGMLYKIVPFLVWFHLQKQLLTLGPDVARPRIPNMRQVIGDGWAQRHFRLHLLAVALLPAALFGPRPVLWLFALILAAAFALLERNLIVAARTYAGAARQLRRIAEGGD